VRKEIKEKEEGRRKKEERRKKMTSPASQSDRFQQPR
jgi:hypothetical protein